MPVVNSRKTRFDVYIGRGSRYGNPFPIGNGRDRHAAIHDFKDWAINQPELLRLVRRELSGKRLGCHCAPAPCHGDILDLIASGVYDKYITPEPIFVFGSNLAGRHGKGAAEFASRHRGAVRGVGQGPTGTCYAIPTKDAQLGILPIADILKGIVRFQDYAASNPNTLFQMTRVGCGLAIGGHADQETLIRAQVLESPSNVLLPGVWELHRNPNIARVIVAGSRVFADYSLLAAKLDALLSRLLRAGHEIEIVSGGAKGADTLGERYAVERGYHIRRFPAEWERFDKAAGHIRNQLMAWYSTHLVAFWDGSSPGTRSMIKTATQDALNCRTIRTDLAA